MLQNPIVSILTPCYNTEKWIERYLINILEQTYTNIQLILINDGSTDRTEEIILSYLSQFENKGIDVTYRFQENGGIGSAINTGLKLINGSYFTWCDSDNFYAINYVQKKVTFFEQHPEYSIVRCDGYYVKDDENFTPIENMARNNKDKFNEYLFEYALEERNYHFGCAMVKTKDFDKINPTREIYPSRYGQNWQILLPMFFHYRSAYIDEPLFYCVQRNDSVSNVNRYLGYEKVVQQQREYEILLNKTIQTIRMEEEQKNKYLKYVKIKYTRRILEIASTYRNLKLLSETFSTLQQLHSVSIKDYLLYTRGRNAFVYKSSKIFHSLISMNLKK